MNLSIFSFSEQAVDKTTARSRKTKPHHRLSGVHKSVSAE
jgi:hypothetical protein